MEVNNHRKITIAASGYLLIACASFILAFTYYPFARLYLFPPQAKAQVSQYIRGYEINIPKINATAPIVRNVNPWNKDEYIKALDKGVAQANTSFDAGDGKGTTYLFAHSSLPPWEITRVNTAFLRLGELEKGDTFEINKDGSTYRYVVLEKKVVPPSETRYLKDTAFKGVVLQTCTPVGTDFNRLLVFAKLTSN